MSQKIGAVIPCYNEALCISDVVSRACKLVDISVVADDNSTDDTVEKVRQHKAYIMRNHGKRGVGANTQAGFDKALALGCDFVVTLDGDGQHNPDEIPELLKPLLNGDADIVIGTRFKGDECSVPHYRRLGIRTITWLYNIWNKQKLSDTLCCFRAFNRNVLSTVYPSEPGYAFCVEMLIKARHAGYRISEIPVHVLYHSQLEQNSSRDPITLGIALALGVIKWRIKTELLGMSN